MRRLWITVVTLIFVAAVMGSLVIPASCKEPVKLTYWHIGGLLSEREVVKKWVEEFNNTHPGLYVEFVEVGWEGAPTKMLSSWATKTLPDVVAYPSPGIGEFSQMGMYVNLEDEFPDIVKDFASRVPPVVLDVARGYDDKIYGLPYGVDLMPLLTYNTRMFEEAGLEEPPKTWSELALYAEKLTKDGVKGFTFPGKEHGGAVYEFLRYWLPQAGGRVLDETGEKIIFNSDVGVRVLQFYVDLVKKRVVPDNILELYYMENARLFFAGKVAMFDGASWLPGVAKDLGAPEDFPYAQTSWPKADPEILGEYEPLGVEMNSFAVLSICSTTEHKNEAIEFIKYMTRDEVLNDWIREVKARIPIAISGLASEDMRLNMPGLYDAYQKGTLFEGAYVWKTIPGQSEINKIVAAECQKAFIGLKTPKQALDDAAREAQRIYDEARKQK